MGISGAQAEVGRNHEVSSRVGPGPAQIQGPSRTHREKSSFIEHSLNPSGLVLSKRNPEGGARASFPLL